MARTQFPRRIHGLRMTTMALFLIGLPSAALAQEPESAPPKDYIEALKGCRGIADPSERLACYDANAGAMIAANEAGDVRIVDREDLRQTRRQLFGFTVPEVGLLKGADQDKEASEPFETTITSARQLSSKAWRFTTAEGAVWEINNAPARLAPIKGGETVQFGKASLGFFFIRINGQMGVKGKRIQ